MPISATGNRIVSRHSGAGRNPSSCLGFGRGKVGSGRRPDGGFTLIELLIVLAIIGLVAASVVIAIPDPRGRLSDEAARFAARTLAARDLAILEGRATAVRVTAQGYAFDRRQGGQWVPLPDPSFRSRPWSRGTVALVGQGGTIRASFDETGQPNMPATIVLMRAGQRERVAIAADGGVRVGS